MSDRAQVADDRLSVAGATLFAGLAIFGLLFTDFQPGRGSLAFENGPPPGFEAAVVEFVSVIATTSVVLFIGLYATYEYWRYRRGGDG